MIFSRRGVILVSRNNIKYKAQQDAKCVPHYGIRKLSIGVASVLLGTVFYMQNGTVHADVNPTVSAGNDSVNVVNKVSGTSGLTGAASTSTGASSVVSAGDATNSTAPSQTSVLPVEGATKQSSNAALAVSEPESTSSDSQVNAVIDNSNAISSLPPASHHQPSTAGGNPNNDQQSYFDVSKSLNQSNLVGLEQSNVQENSNIAKNVKGQWIWNNGQTPSTTFISLQSVSTLLMSSDAAPPQTQAELTVTDSTTGEAFPAETNGNINTEYHLSTTGQFNVRLGDLLNQQRLKLADVTTTSTSGKFMNFSAPTGGFRVEYQGQYLGNLDWDYDQTTGQGSIYLQSVLTNSPFSDLSDDAVISINLVKVPSLVSLNWETDPHRFVPLDPDGSFHETLTITSVGTNKQQSLLFKMKPRKFDHENNSMWTNISASSSANNSTFNDYVTPLLDQNTGSIIDQLNNGTAKLSLNDDLYMLYYDLKPVGNSKLNLDDFSIYVNKLPNAIGSDGRMTKETLWINGPDFKQLKGQNGVTFESSGDNLSFGDLARNDFNGAEWSLQTDGSARIVLKLPKKWLQLTDSDFHQLTDSTVTGVFDQNGEEAAETGAKKFYKQLDNMPTRFVVGFWLPYSNDKLHHDNHYDLSRLAVDGSVIYSGNAKQPDSQVNLHGQTQINVHFVNAYDGNDVTMPLSSIGWPSKDKLSIDWVKSLPTGFDYGKLHDGKLLNGQDYTLPAGYELLTGQPESIDYPAENVVNYVVIVSPKVETASIKFVDDDDVNVKFDSAVASGYFGQKIVFDNYDALLKVLSNRHYKLTGNDFLPGQEIYKLDGNNYTIHLKHKLDLTQRHYRVIEDLPDGTKKVIIDLEATLYKDANTDKWQSDVAYLDGDCTKKVLMPNIYKLNVGQQIGDGLPNFLKAYIDKVSGYAWNLVDGTAGYQDNLFVGFYNSDERNAGEIYMDLFNGLAEAPDVASIFPSHDFHIVYAPKDEAATVNIIDIDENNKVLSTGTVTGKFNTQIVTNDDVQAKLKFLLDTGHYVLQSNGFDQAAKYQDGTNTITIALKHKIDSTQRHYRVIEDLPDGTKKVIIDVEATLYKDANAKYYNEWGASLNGIGKSLKSNEYRILAGQQASSFSNNSDIVAAVDMVPGYVATFVDPISMYQDGVYAVLMNDGKARVDVFNGSGALNDPASGLCAADPLSSRDFHIIYTPRSYPVTVNYYDIDGKLVNSVTSTHKFGDTVSIAPVAPTNYVLVSGQAKTDYLMRPGLNEVDFLVEPKLTTTAETKTVSRTIKVQTPDGRMNDVVQTVTFVRNSYLNQVTKQATYSPWSFGGQYQFSGYLPKPMNGYTADVVPAVIVTPDSLNTTVDVVYHKIPVVYEVDYKLANGTVVKNVSVTPERDGMIHLTAPQGYRLLTTATDVQVGSSSQKLTVLVLPDEQTYTAYSALPSIVTEPLTKTVTRTVKITLPNGHVRTVKQSVKFERTATVAANGKITYSNWTGVGQTSFDRLFVPKRRGYRLVMTDNQGQTLTGVNQMVVDSTMDDAVINVKYIK